MIETKANADACARALDKLVETPTPLRIHWTGKEQGFKQFKPCSSRLPELVRPGSDRRHRHHGRSSQEARPGHRQGSRVTIYITLLPHLGKNMAVPGCNIFVGGKIGQAFHLQLEPEKKNIPIEFDILIPELLEIITTHFDGKLK